MSASQNLRDNIGRFLPSWLSEGDPENPGYGYRLVWTLVLIIDGCIEAVAGASLSAVGRGTSLDADLVGQARGLIRNQDESDEDYARRLGTWVDRAKENGGSTRLILAIHDYLRSHPRIRVFRRDGYCITVDTDRTITTDATTAWDWDSESHPERNDPEAPWWSDLFIVVYTTSGTSEQWPFRAGDLGDMTLDGLGWGIGCNRKEVDDLKSLIQTCKSCHSLIRAVIFCNDETMFDPEDDDSMPNGRWGAWGIYDGGSYVPSDRDLETCRFLEPR
jgi:hypothetical protein